jgi:hypothetical protein
MLVTSKEIIRPRRCAAYIDLWSRVSFNDGRIKSQAHFTSCAEIAENCRGVLRIVNNLDIDRLLHSLACELTNYRSMTDVVNMRNAGTKICETDAK